MQDPLSKGPNPRDVETQPNGIRQGIVTGAIVITNSHKEADMNNSFRNLPTVSDETLSVDAPFQKEAAESRLVAEPISLKVGELGEVIVEQYDGYFRFRTAWSANKHTYGKTFRHADGRITFEGNGGYKGFLSAFHSRLTAVHKGNRGTYMHGIICPMGVENLRDIIDSNNASGELKVNWAWVREDGEEVLRKAGLVRKDDDVLNYWTVYSVNRGRIYRKFVVQPDTWELFTSKLAAKGLSPKDAEAAIEVKFYNKAWAQQNRYDGFEWVNRVLNGKLMVGVKPAEMYDFEYTVNSFNMLFAPEAARQEWLDGNEAAFKGQEILRKVQYGMSQDDYVAPKGVETVANDANVVIWNGTKGEIVTRSFLHGKRVIFVHKDNSPAGQPISVLIRKDSDIDGALVMAARRGGMIALAK